MPTILTGMLSAMTLVALTGVTLTARDKRLSGDRNDELYANNHPRNIYNKLPVNEFDWSQFDSEDSPEIQRVARSQESQARPRFVAVDRNESQVDFKRRDKVKEVIRGGVAAGDVWHLQNRALQ